jgi:hypothetical protein
MILKKKGTFFCCVASYIEKSLRQFDKISKHWLVLEQRVHTAKFRSCLYVINMLGFMPGCQVSLLTKQLIYSKIVLTVFCLLLQQYHYLMTSKLFCKHAVLHKLFVTLTNYLHRRPHKNSLKCTMLWRNAICSN